MRLKISVYCLLLLIFMSQSEVLAQPGKADSIRKVLRKSKTISEINENRLELARAIMPDSLFVVRNLIKLVESDKSSLDNNSIATLNNVKGLYYWFNQEYDQAIDQFKKTLQLPRAQIEDELIAEASNNTGSLFRRFGQNDSAIYYLNISLSVDKQRGNILGIAKNYYDIGTLYSRKSQFELAQRYLLQSAEYFEASGVNSRFISAITALGNLYTQLEDTANAMQMYRKAEALAIKNENERDLIVTYNNICGLLLSNARYEEALHYGKAALEIANRSQGMIPFGVIYVNLGIAYSGLDQVHMAREYFRKAYRTIRNQQSIDKTAILSSIAGFYLKNGLLDSATYFVNESMDLSRQIESHEWLWKGYELMARIDSASGNFRQAFIHMNHSFRIKDSLLSNENRSRIEELRILHQIEKKEAENSSLKQQNELKAAVIRNQYILLFAAAIILLLLAVTIVLQKRAKNKINAQHIVIQKSNEELVQLNKTKDKFLSILAHDLRSPFSSFLGLLQIIIDDYHELSDEKRKELLMKLYTTSNNTYNLVVNLLDWTIAQRNGFKNEPEHCSVFDITNIVYSFLSSRAEQKSHKLINKLNPDLFVYADPNIVSNILINLVNNAIKFTPEGGTIEVLPESVQNGKLMISVADNGIGIPHDKIDSLFDLDCDFQRKGTNNEMGTGLGLILVKEFIAVSDGIIRVESKEGEGSKFIIGLPVGPK